MCLYNKRLDRMTVYQSEEDFGIEQCKHIILGKKKSHMSVRKYVGMDINKAAQEKAVKPESKSVLFKKRGRK